MSQLFPLPMPHDNALVAALSVPLGHARDLVEAAAARHAARVPAPAAADQSCAIGYGRLMCAPAFPVIDNAPALLSNPQAFIAARPIVLSGIDQAAVPAVDNLRTRFLLWTETGRRAPGAAPLPTLHMLPVGSAKVVQLPRPGGMLSTIDALYLRAGDRDDALNTLPYCDIAAIPGRDDARMLFTAPMRGACLVVATEVPGNAPPLAPGHWRVLHDTRRHSLANWRAAGYVLRFAAYVDGAAGAGPMPPWRQRPLVASYNPRNYPCTTHTPSSPPAGERVATNFLWWSGANWTFNSRHHATLAGNAYDLDAIAPGGPSTQSLVL